MVFSSLFFIYLFFPLCMGIYLLVSDINKKNLVLLLFSLVFYSWGGVEFLAILLADTFITYLFALLIDKSEGKKGMQKFLLFLNVFFLLGILGFFKYSGMIIKGIEHFSSAVIKMPDIVLPIGISFYTFQLLSYSVDVYRGEVRAQKKFSLLLLYASLFHQCIAGPIVRYKQIEMEITNRKVSVHTAFRGCSRFCIGLAKKAVLANGCAEIADKLLAPGLLSTSSAVSLWLGMACYMMQIYLDFSAYSDMAIGMGKMVGFNYEENFNYPYLSKSITDFWRRWHISLGSFFRDYVYIPLGGNRVGKIHYIFNLFVVWALTGLWHGASMNFVCWGLYFFVFLYIEKIFFSRFEDRIPSVLRHLYALVIIYFGWIIFHFSNMSDILTVIKGLFCQNENVFLDLSATVELKKNLFFLLVSIIACTPLYKKCHHRLNAVFVYGTKYPSRLLLLWDNLYPAFCLILSTMALIGNSYNPFLYFQF